MNDISERIAVIETKVASLEDLFKETHFAVLDIKQRIDKQNGAIPHIQDDIKEIKTNIQSVATGLAVKTEDLAKSLAAKTLLDSKSQAKLNLLYNAIAVLLTALTFTAVGMIFRLHI